MKYVVESTVVAEAGKLRALAAAAAGGAEGTVAALTIGSKLCGVLAHTLNAHVVH